MNDKSPSLDDVKAHILATFPNFDVKSLFSNSTNDDVKISNSTNDDDVNKTIKFEKGVTPYKTPKSYYPRPQYAASYTKSFTPSQ